MRRIGEIMREQSGFTKEDAKQQRIERRLDAQAMLAGMNSEPGSLAKDDEEKLRERIEAAAKRIIGRHRIEQQGIAINTMRKCIPVLDKALSMTRLERVKAGLGPDPHAAHRPHTKQLGVICMRPFAEWTETDKKAVGDVLEAIRKKDPVGYAVVPDCIRVDWVTGPPVEWPVPEETVAAHHRDLDRRSWDCDLLGPDMSGDDVAADAPRAMKTEGVVKR